MWVAAGLTVTDVASIAPASGEMGTGAWYVVRAIDRASVAVRQSSTATDELAARSSRVSAAMQSNASIAEDGNAAGDQFTASARRRSAGNERRPVA